MVDYMSQVLRLRKYLMDVSYKLKKMTKDQDEC